MTTASSESGGAAHLNSSTASFLFSILTNLKKTAIASSIEDIAPFVGEQFSCQIGVELYA